MKNLIALISTGIFTVFLAAGCSATNESYPKGADAAVPSTASKQSSLSSDSQDQISGDWVCKDGQACSYSQLSLSKDGTAVAMNSVGESDCEIRYDGKISITQKSNRAHLDLSISGSGTLLDSDSCDANGNLSAPATDLSADLSLPGQALNELKLSSGSGTGIYVRKQ